LKLNNLLTKLVFDMIGPVEIDSRQEISNNRLVKKNVHTIPKKKRLEWFAPYTQQLHKVSLL
jgi:hypothetical protein